MMVDEMEVVADGGMGMEEEKLIMIAS